MRWSFEDGTTLETGGDVEGEGKAAEKLREAFAWAWMHVAALPSDRVEIDRSSSFLLHLLALGASGSAEVDFTTDYVFREDDAPTVLVSDLRARAFAARGSRLAGKSATPCD